MRTSEYVDALKPLTGTGSLYAVAKLMAVSEPALHRYWKGQRYFDEYACLRVSELLNIPIKRVLADVALERETDPAKREVWSDLLRKFAAVVLMGSAISLGLGGSFHSEQAKASTGKVGTPDFTIYKLYAKRVKQLWIRFLR